MVKETQKNDKFNYAVIISVILHLILIVILIVRPLQKNITSTVPSDDNGSIVATVMINPSAAVKQYNHQKQNNDLYHTRDLHQKKTQQQTEEAQQKQAVVAQRLKALKKERLAIQEKTARQAKILAKHQKAAEKSKIKTDKMAIVQPDAQKKAEAKNAVRKKDSAQQAKNTAAAVKQSAEVNDLFNRLSDGKNAPKREGKQKWHDKPVEQGNAKTAGLSSADINNYMAQIQGVIQSKFYNPGSFTGKTCELRIQLAPDGLLISVQKVDGDLALCQAAITATKLAEISKPPNDAVYQYFKNFTLEFKPS